MTFYNKKLISLTIFIILFVIFIGFLSIIGSVDAQELEGLKDTGKGIGYKTETEKSTREEIASVIGKIIGAVVSLIGIIFIILIFAGALDIIGAGGNDETVLKGKDKIKNGAIGVLLVFAAYMFAKLLLMLIVGKTPIIKL